MIAFLRPMRRALLLVLLLPACAEEPTLDAADPAESLTGNDAPALQRSSECQSGAVRACTVQLPSQDGQKNCIVGEQRCTAEGWGDCVERVGTQTP